MREIKFRAFHIFQKRYIYNIEAISFRKGVVYENGVPHRMTSIVLEEYTGLKDKNGMEICEGDLVMMRRFSARKSEVVLITIDEFGVLPKTADGNPYDNDDYYQGLDVRVHNWQDSYVIGNIHQNKELLK